MSQTAPTLREAILNKRMLICIFTGFSSGLPLFVFINLLPAWLSDAKVDIKAIGLMALLQIPYVAKFMWAPLLDHFSIGMLGRRRGWMILLHLGLIVSLILMGRMDPASQLMAISAMGLVVTFLSATLDIAIDAYRRELLPDVELGLGNTIHVNAYNLVYNLLILDKHGGRQTLDLDEILGNIGFDKDDFALVEIGHKVFKLGLVRLAR